MIPIRKEKGYIVCVTLFSVLLVLCNIVGGKFFKMPLFDGALPCSILVYPLTFVLSDLVTEVWGKERANFMVYLGLVSSVLMIFVILGALHLTPHKYWAEQQNQFGFSSVKDYQNAFESVFSVSYKILFGSLIAFLTAQLVDIRIYLFFKKLTKDRHLWLRNNLSTWVSQLIDTFIVNSIVLYWGLKMPFTIGLEIMLATYIIKVLISVGNTPLFYLGVRWAKKYIQEEDVTAS